jgi:hypothetical protein
MKLYTISTKIINIKSTKIAQKIKYLRFVNFVVKNYHVIKVVIDTKKLAKKKII